MTVLAILADGARELGLELSQEQLERFERYSDVLTDWSERVSLTAVRDEEGIQRRHFLESAALVPLLAEEDLSLKDRSLIDVGSGSGIPGVPLKILEPSLQLTLVEAKQRKTEFLQALLLELGFDDVVVLPRRAEGEGGGAGGKSRPRGAGAAHRRAARPPASGAPPAAAARRPPRQGAPH